MSSVFSERRYTGRTEEQEAGSFEGLLGVRGQSGKITSWQAVGAMFGKRTGSLC